MTSLSKCDPYSVFIDEAGNTGHNIFDIAQPRYLSVAMLVRGDFDRFHNADVEQLARKIGMQELHANEMGVAVIEKVALDILSLIKKKKIRFVISGIIKKDIAKTKLFDTLFDSGENLATPWHVYNLDC